MNYGKNGIRRKIKSTQSWVPKLIKKGSLLVLKIALIGAIGAAACGVAAGIGAYKGIIDESPEIGNIDLSPSGIQSIIYDSAGNEIQTLVMAGTNRDPIEYEDIPEVVINAFIAIEDARFWEHNGVDLKGIVRAGYEVLSGGTFQGGSTITQQLIKNNVFSGGNEGTMFAKVQRKLQEQYLAVQAEQMWSKEKILEDYLNTINLGNNCLGIQVAAERYFGKNASDLTLSEATVLAAITSAPTRYNPILHPDDNLRRRKIVLQYMVNQGYITEEEQQAALEDNVYERIALHNQQIEDYEDTVYSYFTDAVVNQVLEDLQTKAGYSSTEARRILYGGGLRIYTTQDPAIQAIVDEEVNNEANYAYVKYGFTYQLSVQHPKAATETTEAAEGEEETEEENEVTNYSEGHVKQFLQAQTGTSIKLIFNTQEEIYSAVEQFKASVVKEGDVVLGERLYITLQPQVSFVIMDQYTGYVKAIAGGRGVKETSLSLNRAVSTPRQPGSCFKIITSFAPALDACGATLATVFYDTETVYNGKQFNNWWSAGYTGYSNIRQGVIYSMNIVAVRCLMDTVSARLGFNYALNFGFSTLIELQNNADGTTFSDIGPALALGGLTRGVTNIDLTAAYAAIANGGTYKEPLLYTKITDNAGRTVLDNTQYQRSHTVIRETTAFLLTDAMKASMEYNQYFSLPIYSTSTKAHLDNMACAGKSGTTTDNNDLWFVGFTPYFTAGIWEGYDVNDYIDESSASTKIIWKNIMTRIHEGLPNPGFVAPSGIVQAQICLKCGRLAVGGLCDQDPRGNMIATEYFAAGTVPTEYCVCHTRVEVCNDSHQLLSQYCPEASRGAGIFMVISDPNPGVTYDSTLIRPTVQCQIHSPEWAATSTEETTEESTEETTKPTEPTAPSPVPPSTETPVTNPPVTDPPVTDPPVTDPPVTDPPVTDPPVTDPPVTDPPVTDPPVTDPPVTDPAPVEPEQPAEVTG